MDRFALALKIKRAAVWLDSRWRPHIVRKQFIGDPFGEIYVTIDPAHQGPHASAKLNRVYLCGAEQGLTPKGLQQLISLFADSGVQRFFVWLSPGPDMDAVRGWLRQSGLSPIPWVTYPTLVRERCEAVRFKTDLGIREVGAEEVAARREHPPQCARGGHQSRADRARPAPAAHQGARQASPRRREPLARTARKISCRPTRQGIGDRRDGRLLRLRPRRLHQRRRDRGGRRQFGFPAGSVISSARKEECRA
jgi:hypothetical protein